MCAMTAPARQIEAKNEEFAFELDCLLAAVKKSAIEQYNYNIRSNLPAGIVAVDDLVDHALQHGVVKGAAYLHQRTCEKTVAIAVDILSDSNCHTEAAALQAAWDKTLTENPVV